MRIKVVVSVSIISAILVISGLAITANYSRVGVEQAYSLLPGIPSSESPFSEFVNLTTENNAHYPPDYEILSTNPYITRIDYTNHSKISRTQARKIARDFLEAILSPDVFDIIDYGSSHYSGLLPRWIFEFKNSTQDPKTHIIAFVGVNSLSGAIVYYSGPLPESVMLNMADFDEVEVAKATFEVFNTSIPSNSRYEQFTHDDSQFYFVFTQTVGPVVIHSSVGGIYLDINMNTTFGDRCFYSMEWIPFSEISTEYIMSPILPYDYVLGNLILIPAPYEVESEVHDYRLCWWLLHSNFPERRDMIIDAYSGEIVQYIYYHS